MKLICNFISFLKISVIIQEKWQIKYWLHWVLQYVFKIFFNMITYNTTRAITKACTNTSYRRLWCLQFLWWYLEFSSIILLPVHDPLKRASKIICFFFLSFIPYVPLSTSLLSPLLFSCSFYVSILSSFLSSLLPLSLTSGPPILSFSSSYHIPFWSLLLFFSL